MCPIGAQIVGNEINLARSKESSDLPTKEIFRVLIGGPRIDESESLYTRMTRGDEADRRPFAVGAR